jgi:hypothetical protein
MTFDEWWKADIIMRRSDVRSRYSKAKDAYEAGIQEGIQRMYRLYDICPQCKLPNGQHKMDCGRGR